MARGWFGFGAVSGDAPGSAPEAVGFFGRKRKSRVPVLSAEACRAPVAFIARGPAARNFPRRGEPPRRLSRFPSSPEKPARPLRLAAWRAALGLVLLAVAVAAVPVQAFSSPKNARSSASTQSGRSSGIQWPQSSSTPPRTSSATRRYDSIAFFRQPRPKAPP